MNTPDNVIAIESAYIEKVLSYDPKGRNYFTLVTKASKAARASLHAIGWTEEQAHAIVLSAYGVAQHERVCLAQEVR